ncbi:ankyrin repeat and SOCS box protein 3 [Patella vulgata]|uniref:ankyrin repeat and SOCS box protein 3 n=1 Tax=Patella vulgata TaxID=6465 RepID=UPI00217FFCC4|nr:ankyrin repeat and SOCS box protein 3 [Patella vulgata]
MSENEPECSKTEETDDSDDSSDCQGRSILKEKNILRLLSDALTFKSPLEDIELIINCGANVNGSVKRGLRPLHYAVYVDYVEGARLLIEKGADVNQPDDIGYTPMHVCARKGALKSMRLLIENGAFVDFFAENPAISENIRDLGYLTIEPLNLAVENNNVDCLRLLLESGARPDHKYFMGYEINLVPIDHVECLELLLQYGADPNVCNRCGITPLMKSCRQQRLDVVRLLLTYAADVNLQSPPRFDQKSALHFCVQVGNSGIAHTLLRHGAKPGKLDNYNYGALHIAVLKDRVDFCEMFLKWNADVNEFSDDRTTPLVLACATPNLTQRKQIIELLLDNGADPNKHAGIVSYTSPCLSALTEYLRIQDGETITYDVVHLLIKHGAKVHFKGQSSPARLKDPFGILHYMSNLKDKDDIFSLLAVSAQLFDLPAIQRYSGLLDWQRRLLISLSSAPRSLKHLVRQSIRQMFLQQIPKLVNDLPVPSIIKQYLLYEHY